MTHIFQDRALLAYFINSRSLMGPKHNGRKTWLRKASYLVEARKQNMEQGESRRRHPLQRHGHDDLILPSTPHHPQFRHFLVVSSRFESIS